MNEFINYIRNMPLWLFVLILLLLWLLPSSVIWIWFFRAKKEADEFDKKFDERRERIGNRSVGKRNK